MARRTKTKKKISFVGVPTRILQRELSRRASIAYARNVNREMRERWAANRERVR